MLTSKIIEVMADPSVHNFTKDIIREAMKKDALDVVYDVELALKCLRERLDLIVAANSHNQNVYPPVRP